MKAFGREGVKALDLRLPSKYYTGYKVVVLFIH